MLQHNADDFVDLYLVKIQVGLQRSTPALQMGPDVCGTQCGDEHGDT